MAFFVQNFGEKQAELWHFLYRISVKTCEIMAFFLQNFGEKHGKLWHFFRNKGPFRESGS